MKKVLILPVGFILIHVLYIGCCKCPSPRDFYEVTGVSVSAKGNRGIVIDNGQPVAIDTAYLNYDFANKCVAKASFNFSFLVNTATACKCHECGEGGLKNKMTSCIISSDSVFNGVASNQPLNQFFKVTDFYVPGNSYSLDSLLNNINNNGRKLIGGYQIFTTVKPGTIKGHKFTLVLKFSNGSTVSVLTNRIIWQ